MCAVDRTAEFHRILADLGERIPATKAPTNYASNDLYKACSTVGTQLEQMQSLIKQLHRQVQKKGVFDDQSAQSDQLILQINNSNSTIGDSITRLNDVATGLGKNSANESIKAAVNTLKIRHRDALLDFQRACELRNKNLIHQSQVKGKYMPSRPAPQAISGMDIMDDDAGEEMGMMSGNRNQKVLDGGYSQSKMQGLQSVQKAINEIGQMFKKMSDLIEMQEEQIMRIDADIDETAQNFEVAEKDLLTYLKNISGNRALILKIFGIIIFFIVFFIMFLS